MQIHSICVVKNEADIIALCIHEALRWSDYIYIYDGASDDGTWEIAQALQSDRVIAWKSDGKVFQEGLRAEVFNAFKDRVQDGDWWCHLDADEFYVSDPKVLLSNVPPPRHVVWDIMIEYYLTQGDVENIDLTRPVAEIIPKLKYYAAQNSEPRFFRHRKGLAWDVNSSWPNHMGLAHFERICFKHYKYRSPAQIQRRLDTRHSNRERGFPGWDNSKALTWKEKIVDGHGLYFDKDDNQYQVDWAALPDHQGSVTRRSVKWLMHTLGIWP